MNRPVLPGIALLLAFAAPAAVHAAPPQLFLPNKNATSIARVILPAQIIKLYDMDFGLVTVTCPSTP